MNFFKLFEKYTTAKNKKKVFHFYKVVFLFDLRNGHRSGVYIFYF